MARIELWYNSMYLRVEAESRKVCCLYVLVFFLDVPSTALTQTLTNDMLRLFINHQKPSEVLNLFTTLRTVLLLAWHRRVLKQTGTTEHDSWANQEAKMMLPLLPPLLPWTSGCVWKVLHEQKPSTLSRVGASRYDAPVAGSHLSSPLLLSAVRTVEREREWSLSDSSDTRIPAGHTHLQDCHSHVAGEHLSLKWRLSMRSLMVGGLVFFMAGGCLGENLFIGQFSCFTGTTISKKIIEDFVSPLST